MRLGFSARMLCSLLLFAIGCSALSSSPLTWLVWPKELAQLHFEQEGPGMSARFISKHEGRPFRVDVFPAKSEDEARAFIKRRQDNLLKAFAPFDPKSVSGSDCKPSFAPRKIDIAGLPALVLPATSRFVIGPCRDAQGDYAAVSSYLFCQTKGGLFGFSAFVPLTNTNAILAQLGSIACKS